MKERVEVALVQMSTEWLQPEKNREKMRRFIGQVARDIPAGYCYMVPPDGKSFHANINVTAKPTRMFYFGLYKGGE